MLDFTIGKKVINYTNVVLRMTEKKKSNTSSSENCLDLIINRSRAEHESTMSFHSEKGKCQTKMQIETSFRKNELNSAVLGALLRLQLNTVSICGHQTSKTMPTNKRICSASNENYHRYKKYDLWGCIESVSINLVQIKKYYVGHGKSQKSFRKYSENLSFSKK